MRRILIFFVLCPMAPLLAQNGRPIRVYLDCQNFHCDFDHFRRQIRFVDWVRERRDAQVHVLGTAQRTGSGGREFTLTFLGQGGAAGRTDTLRYASSQTDTDVEVRDGLARTLALGLVRYAAATPLAARLSVGYEEPDGTNDSASEQADPWNYWVFRLRAGASIQGERLQNAQSLDGGFSARRVTEAFKIDLAARGDYSRDAFDLDDTTRVVSTSNFWEFEGIAVWSLGPHWSLGVRSQVGGSTFFNRRLSVEAGPTLEFNVFPYQESTRRIFTIALTPQLIGARYDELTIFDRTEETRFQHELEVGLAQREPWGEVNASASWRQYWHDWHRHRLDLFGGISLRVVRGLSFNLRGNVARVKDQLYLPAEDLTPEEILLRRRQLGTDFRYSVNLGLSFTFGSIYNNVVNPRIDN